MLKIAHRINTPEQLKATPLEYGVEMDLHAYDGKLVVHHDAFQAGVPFEEWLNAYRHAYVILNIKEEGIEAEVLKAVKARGIENYFLLDVSFPSLVKLSNAGEHRIAARVSSLEPVESALRVKSRVQWVWLDVFEDACPITKAEYDQLKAAGFSLCLVSPELHGRDVARIFALRAEMQAEGIVMDAVCTKLPELW